jgi:hypothetical protein
MSESIRGRTFSKQTDEVWLTTGRYIGFSKVPRRRLLNGVERIAEIRADIGRLAKVAAMPPVEVVPYVWQDADSMAHGRMTLLASPKGTFLGVQLPAQTAVCSDLEAVRTVLIHEFAHCFYFATQIVNAFDRPNVNSRAHVDMSALINAPDDELLVDPREWFGESDAKAFLQANDRGTRAIDDLVPTILKQFRTAMPETSLSLGIVCIDDEVKGRIRSLRKSAGN